VDCASPPLGDGLLPVFDAAGEPVRPRPTGDVGYVYRRGTDCTADYWTDDGERITIRMTIGILAEGRQGQAAVPGLGVLPAASSSLPWSEHQLRLEDDQSLRGHG
jgi:hypothetical protein